MAGAPAVCRLAAGELWLRRLFRL